MTEIEKLICSLCEETMGYIEYDQYTLVCVYCPKCYDKVEKFKV